jgi:hypothetical protein
MIFTIKKINNFYPTPKIRSKTKVKITYTIPTINYKIVLTTQVAKLKHQPQTITLSPTQKPIQESNTQTPIISNYLSTHQPPKMFLIDSTKTQQINSKLSKKTKIKSISLKIHVKIITIAKLTIFTIIKISTTPPIKQNNQLPSTKVPLISKTSPLTTSTPFNTVSQATTPQHPPNPPSTN